MAAPARAEVPAAPAAEKAPPELMPTLQSVLDPMADPRLFPAPDPRARRLLGYASPWTPLCFVATLVLLAALINRFNPKKKRRIRRSTILLMLYSVSFLVAVGLHFLHGEEWSRRVWFLAELFHVLMVINLTAIFGFDLLLLALRVELADIAHDLLLGAGYLLAFIGMLQSSGVNLSGIVATSAVMTAVLGLSLQATLANVLGGIALQIDKSITVGDWIQLQNGQQGKVKAIRWRSTLLETRNWDTVVVPNSALLGEHITVLGQRTDQPRQHRMWVYFHVDYRFSPDEVIRVIDEALQAAPITNVAAEPQAHTICTDFADGPGTDGVATYAVRYWLTDLAKDDPTSSAVRVRIFTALKRAEIPLALPAHALFVQQDDKEREERKVQQEMARRVSALEAIEMLQLLSTEERIQLARCMRFAPFGRGEVMTRQGAQAHWLYVLIKGDAEVKVTLPGKPGEPPFEKLVQRLSAPNVFGEMGVMTGEPRTASVIAATEVECFRIDRETFHALVKKRPELAESISAVMARRRVELQTVREGLSQEQKNGRMQEEGHRVLAEIQSFFGLGEP